MLSTIDDDPGLAQRVRASNWHRSQLEGADTLREAGIIVDRMEHFE